MCACVVLWVKVSFVVFLWSLVVGVSSVFSPAFEALIVGRDAVGRRRRDRRDVPEQLSAVVPVFRAHLHPDFAHESGERRSRLRRLPHAAVRPTGSAAR